MTDRVLSDGGTREIFRAQLCVLGGAVLLAVASWFRVEHLWSGPVPAPLIYLALQSLGVPRSAWFLAGPLLLLSWSPQLLVASSRIPMRTVIGLGVLTIVAAFHLWAGWQYAVSHRGWLAVLGIATVSAGSLVPLWVLCLSALHHPTVCRSVSLHLAVVTWLVTLAFPSILELL